MYLKKEKILEYRLLEKFESYQKKSLLRNHKIEKQGTKYLTKIYLCFTTFFLNIDFNSMSQNYKNVLFLIMIF